MLLKFTFFFLLHSLLLKWAGGEGAVPRLFALLEIKSLNLLPSGSSLLSDSAELQKMSTGVACGDRVDALPGMQS